MNSIICALIHKQFVHFQLSVSTGARGRLTDIFSKPLFTQQQNERQTDRERRREGEREGGGGGGRSFVLLVACLTSQQHASVSQGRICTDNFTCCHTEIEAADQTFHLTQSQYTDTGPTSPSADPITPGAWQVSPWSANF